MMARLLREVEGGSAVRARFVGDGVSASGRGLCEREAPGWLRRGACSAGCCASGSAGAGLWRAGCWAARGSREEWAECGKEIVGPGWARGKREREGRWAGAGLTWAGFL